MSISEEKHITVHGLKVRYKESGTGFPLLLLHGWGGSADSFDLLTEQLSKEKYRIIAPDFPGFGKTDPDGKPWNVSAYRQFTEAFLDALGIEDFFLFGHSHGGRVSIKYAVHDPKRIKGVVLCCCAGIKPKMTIKRAILYVMAKIGKAIFSLPILKQTRSFFQRILYKIAGSGDYIETRGVMRESFLKVIGEDLRPFLSKIHIPTLLIWGKNDTMTPVSDAKVMEQEIQGSRLVVLEDGKHGVHKTHAEEVAELIEDFFGELQ